MKRIAGEANDNAGIRVFNMTDAMSYSIPPDDSRVEGDVYTDAEYTDAPNERPDCRLSRATSNKKKNTPVSSSILHPSSTVEHVFTALSCFWWLIGLSLPRLN
ncbi:hypothetical protein BU16DRAFT_568256 [Lophium mytilinum]|uniref:Uncharacterized protein n=1 Tax=Lophium mytilinum TaxID=390894 RepID=A0A6A6Q8V1_9PEZI|nr:hypothetical protein BU16DRAFT_568256 [Lophium mytilinum]